MKIELAVPCSAIEEMICFQYKLDEPVKLTDMEYDEMGDLCAFTFETDAENTERIHRNWDDSAFACGIVEEAI